MKHPSDPDTERLVTDEKGPPPKLYGHAHDLHTLEPYYSRHVSAMTAEGLHAKSDIAAELAWRDMQLRARVDAAFRLARLQEIRFDLPVWTEMLKELAGLDGIGYGGDTANPAQVARFRLALDGAVRAVSDLLIAR